jgi:ABC-type transporter Mla subunit MlaD
MPDVFWNFLLAVDPTGFLYWTEVRGQDGETSAWFSALLTTILFLSMAGLTLWAYLQRVRPLHARTAQLSASRQAGAAAPEAPYAALPWLAPSVEEYREQCWRDQERLQRDRPASAFLRVDELTPSEDAWLDTVPSILSALGIFGTFLGITIGLSSLDMSPDQIEAGISKLVASLGLSFRSSLWGLSLSIILGAVLRRAQESFAAEVQKTCDLLDKSTQASTVQSLLVRVHEREQQARAEAERARAERAATDQAWMRTIEALVRATHEAQESGVAELKAMQSGLADVLERSFNQAIHRSGLLGSIENMSTAIAKQQAEGAGQLLNEFTEQLGEHFGQSFQALGTSITQMVTANGAYEASMQELVRGLEAGAAQQRESVGQIQQAVVGISGAVAQMDGVSRDLGAAAATIRDASTSVSALLDNQRDVSNSQEATTARLLDGLNQQVTHWDAHQTSISAAFSDLRGDVDGLRAALSDLTAWHDQVRGALTSQIEGWQAAIDQQHGLTRTFGEERGRIAELVNALARTAAGLDAVGARVESLSGSLQTDLGALQAGHSQGSAEINAVATQLGEVSARMKETWLEFGQAAEQLGRAVPDIATLLAGLSEAVTQQGRITDEGRRLATSIGEITTLQGRLRDDLSAVTEATRAARDGLAPSAQAIASSAESLRTATAGVSGMLTNLTSVTTGLKNWQDVLRAQTDSALKESQNVVGEMRGISSNLGGLVERYNTAVNAGLSSQLNAFDGALENAIQRFIGAVGAMKELVGQLEEVAEHLAGKPS